MEATLPAPPGWEGVWPPVGERDPKWVFAYLRVSSKEQGKRTSALDQLEDVLRLAFLNEMSVIGVFMDDDEGTTFERPSFQVMRKLLGQSAAGGIIVSNMNRFTRTAKTGILTLIELSDQGSPLLFPHDTQGTDLTVANMDQMEGNKRAVEAAWEAQRDWEEHQRKTQKGVQSRVNLGIQDRELKAGWLLFHRQLKLVEELEEKRHVLQARLDGRAIFLHWLTTLQKEPTKAQFDTLAQQYDRSPKACMTELRSYKLLGIFEYGSFTSKGVIPGLAVAEYDEFVELEAILDHIERPDDEVPEEDPAPPPAAELPIVEEMVQATSVEYAERVSNGRITVLCDEILTGGRTCDKPTTLNAANISGKRRDRRVCPDGHRTLHPKQGVYATLNDGPSPYCPNCGMFEHAKWTGQSRISGNVIHRMWCNRCQLSWDQPWDGRPAYRRVQREKAKRQGSSQPRVPKQSKLTPAEPPPAKPRGNCGG